jgi:hypothetical protein
MDSVAASSFLATKISYINAMAEVCEATGADVQQLAQALSFDTRIGGRFLRPGLGFGGGCLPKDIRAFETLGGAGFMCDLLLGIATLPRESGFRTDRRTRSTLRQWRSSPRSPGLRLSPKRRSADSPTSSEK